MQRAPKAGALSIMVYSGSSSWCVSQSCTK